MFKSDIPAYEQFVSQSMRTRLLREGKPVAGIPKLVEVGAGGGLETKEALNFVCKLYDQLKAPLNKVLEQRVVDRKFIDERTKAIAVFNKNLKRDLLDDDYQTVIGLEDAKGRVVIGPLRGDFASSSGKPVAPIPEFLKGPHVTLFGPPDSAKLSINAMNSYHRHLPGEPEVVRELLATSTSLPKWGADDEDSKTPLRADLVSAGVNLSGCFDGTLKEVDSKSGKIYEINTDKQALPIKRFPGLAMPCPFLFYCENPLPLHIYDFALHLFKNWHNPSALVFYVPKLENEEEARYIHLMMKTAEENIKTLHSEYVLGTIRLMIVLENPRAILRAHEIMDELYPYFAGASLGWHDYLASTARLFKEDSNYRIPVKADPDIVIKYIKASHNLLADTVGSRGGIKVGGMYGILPTTTDLKSASFQITLKGYIKDVVTQMKRHLTGFWVAHPDFVRLGLALVEAWKFHAKGESAKLDTLVKSLLNPEHHQEILDFIHGPDIDGLDIHHPRFVRSLIVADIKESTFIANNHPDEIRYNVFQALQYLADWLSGNGCVALPAQVGGVPVRVMDDLATAERSRWEVWHEIYHDRFALTDFLQIAHEEFHFIRKDLSDEKKIVQVKWDERTEKWYPVALKLMIQLMTNGKPVEFATELLLPFTVETIREASDPWAAAFEMDPEKYTLAPFVNRFNYYFERCGVLSFATHMAQNLIQDESEALQLIQKFTKSEIIEAASFHGDIGGGQKTLDHLALGEQALVLSEDEKSKTELAQLGSEYLSKFGVKFLVSAQGKTGKELLSLLKMRITCSEIEELSAARAALMEITKKRLHGVRLDSLYNEIDKLRDEHKIVSAGFSFGDPSIQSLEWGDANCETKFQVASLSKSVASAFAIEFFTKAGISLETKVNTLLEKTNSTFRITPALHGDEVTLAHLMSHSALNMHYVKGAPTDKPMPELSSWLKDVSVLGIPGKEFHYSGGGFLVLEHLLTQMTGKTVGELTRPFLDSLNMKSFDFEASHQKVPGTIWHFPAFAAGAVSTAKEMHLFLCELTSAFQNPEHEGPISHDTARLMLLGADKGCVDFMGCLMGLGVFIAEAGSNRFMVHQGANDGFRAIYLHCFQGPDTGKGLVAFARGEVNAVQFIALATQKVLRAMNVQGIDFEQFKNEFSTKDLSAEEIVNIGYKELVFKAFIRDLPPEITDKGEQDPLREINFAAGAQVVSVSNERFALAKNLVSTYLPKFDPELFCFQGKVMDSWETVRHNLDGMDHLVLKLKKPSKFQYVTFSTKYHFGNHSEQVRLLGKKESGEWTELIPKTTLKGHSINRIKLDSITETISEIRVEMFPDGGLTRLGLYLDLPEDEKKLYPSNTEYQEKIPIPKKPLSLPFNAIESEVSTNTARFNRGDEWDVASSALGAKVIKASNEHYSPASLLISPYAPMSMFDGMESARSRKPGNFEEVIVQLAVPSVLHRLEMDFTFFVNNNPLDVSVHGLCKGEWIELVAKCRVKAFAGNKKIVKLKNQNVIEQLRVKTYPDGGMNRLHAYSIK